MLTKIQKLSCSILHFPNQIRRYRTSDIAVWCSSCVPFPLFSSFCLLPFSPYWVDAAEMYRRTCLQVTLLEFSSFCADICGICTYRGIVVSGWHFNTRNYLSGVAAPPTKGHLHFNTSHEPAQNIKSNSPPSAIFSISNATFSKRSTFVWHFIKNRITHTIKTIY